VVQKKRKSLYLDSNHNIVSKVAAKWQVIHIFDADDNLIQEDWVDLKKP
jgi:hypothetical protein